jgi:hypothetical protein
MMRLQRLGATGKSRRGNRLRTYDQLREALRQAGVSMGPWFGPRAEEVLPTVADSVQFVLASELETYEPIGMVRWICKNFASV